MSPLSPKPEVAGSFSPDGEARPLALIAGRHDDTRQMMRHLLETWGFRVAEAGSCGEAPAVAEQNVPSLVLLDTSIPFTETLNAAASIRNGSKTREIPIILISGFGQEAFRYAALAQGVNRYFVKPIDLDVLRDHVQRLIRGRGDGQVH